MKIKTIVILVLGQVLFLGSVFNAEAQEKIASYSMSALENKEPLNFDINLSEDNTLWVDVFSAYEPGVRCGLKLEERYKPNFITTVKNAGILYTEWKRWAIENNIQEIKKKMHYIFYTGGYFSYFDKLNQDDNVRIVFAFTYFKDDYVLIMNLEKMSAMDNDRITFDGGTIVFNSEDEINNFINLISTESLSNFRASQSQHIGN